MSKKYAVQGLSESGTANKTAANIIGSTSIRPMICDLVFSCITTPADQQLRYQVGRTTAAGVAASNPTPLALDSGDVAAVSTAGITHSSEPTYASTFFLDFALNHRATFRWVAEPGGELIGSATASNGVAGKLASAASACQVSMVTHFRE